MAGRQRKRDGSGGGKHRNGRPGGGGGRKQGPRDGSGPRKCKEKKKVSDGSSDK